MRPFLPEVLEVTSQVLEPYSFVLLLFFFLVCFFVSFLRKGLISNRLASLSS